MACTVEDVGGTGADGCGAAGAALGSGRVRGIMCFNRLFL